MKFSHVPSRLPVAALCTFALVATFEFSVVWRNRDHLRDPAVTLLERKKQALSKSDTYDAVIFGNSRFYHLDSAAVAGALSLPIDRVINLSWAWSGVEIYEGMLRHLITSHQTPRIIILDGLPEAFGYPTQFLSVYESAGELSRFTSAVPFRTWAGMMIKDRQLTVLWKAATYQYTLPSLRYRSGIINRFPDWLTFGENPDADFQRIVTHWEQTGWNLYVAPESLATQEELESLRVYLGPFHLRDNTKILERYERFFELANRHQIQILILPVPSNPILYKDFEEYHIFAAYEKWLAKLKNRYSNVQVASPSQLQWGSEILGDAGHVNERGRVKHMDFVVEKINEHLAQ